MDKQLEMTTELRKARNWILAVGVIMFAMDMLFIYVLNKDVPASVKSTVTMYSVIIFAYFIGMYVLARWKPVAACVLALVGFWALHLYVATQNPASLAQGIILKIFFTLALIKGIKSASRAEQLKKELAEVFG